VDRQSFDLKVTVILFLTVDPKVSWFGSDPPFFKNRNRDGPLAHTFISFSIPYARILLSFFFIVGIREVTARTAERKGTKPTSWRLTDG